MTSHLKVFFTNTCIFILPIYEFIFLFFNELICYIVIILFMQMEALRLLEFLRLNTVISDLLMKKNLQMMSIKLNIKQSQWRF